MISFDQNGGNGSTVNLNPIYSSLAILSNQITALDSLSNLTSLSTLVGGYYSKMSDLSVSSDYPYIYNVSGTLNDTSDVAGRSVIMGPCSIRAKIFNSLNFHQFNVASFGSNFASSLSKMYNITVSAFHNNSMSGGLNVKCFNAWNNSLANNFGDIYVNSFNSNTIKSGMLNFRARSFLSNSVNNGFDEISCSFFNSNTLISGADALHIRTSASLNSFESMKFLDVKASYMKSNTYLSCNSINNTVITEVSANYDGNTRINLYVESFGHNTVVNCRELNISGIKIGAANSTYSFSGINTININCEEIAKYGKMHDCTEINITAGNAQNLYISNVHDVNVINTKTYSIVSDIPSDNWINFSYVYNVSYSGFNKNAYHHCNFVSIYQPAFIGNTHTFSNCTLAIFDGPIYASCDGLKTAAFYPDVSLYANYVSGTTYSMTIPRCYEKNRRVFA